MVKLQLEIPDAFFDEEERDGYWVSGQMKKVWAVELDLLKKLMDVCNDNNITFYGDAGTILGAVRHGGFIPWDDDIDVMLMRDQYDRLCKVAPSAFDAPYFFQTEYTDPGSLRGHAQLRRSDTAGILRDDYGFSFNQGIFIDIFPIDVLPDDERDRKSLIDEALRQQIRYTRLASLGIRYKKGRGRAAFLRSAIHFLCEKAGRYPDYQKAYRKYEEVCSSYLGTDMKEVSKLFKLPLDTKRRVWPKSDFDSTVYLDFEMLKIPVPGGYLDILERFYGNWKEKKIGTATHGETIFDADKSYTEYIGKRA